MIINKILHTNDKEKQAIVYGSRVYSYADLCNEILIRAAYFQTNITQQRVLLAHSDSLENLFNALALMAIGKVAIFSSKYILPNHLQHFQQQYDTATVEFSLKIKDLAGSTNAPNEVFVAQTNTVFLGVLTSGTTALPKVIWKDYQSWASAFEHQSQVFGINSADRLLVLDALSYSANLNSALHILWQGGTLILTSLKWANRWTQQIEKEQVSSVFMVPSHYRLLLKNTPILSTLKSVVSAGEKLDTNTAKALLQACPNALVTEYYGAAELGHISYHQGKDIITYGYSVGKAFPAVEISIVEQKICVESPYISPDYRQNKTVHDIGYFEDDRLVVLGREGRMFNKRGLNVFAEEIENCIHELPFVYEVAAIGKRQKDGSDEICVVFSFHASVVPTNDYHHKIRQHLLAKLPPAKHPRRIVALDNLPHKDFGKINYQAIARHFDEEDISAPNSLC
jgi:long-chain acyl-CoA synthetase